MPQKEDNLPPALRAVAVLEAVVAADQPSTLAELAAALPLPKPTLYRILSMLEGANLVAREPHGRRYAAGLRLTAIARAAILNDGRRAARRAILARLVDLIGETCNFTMLDGEAVVYLERVETAWPLRITLSPGSRVPLHCTASGKLLLAMLPESTRTRLLAHLTLTSHTHKTITDRRRLVDELARIRRQKYATDNEEFYAGLVCVAVPVADARRVWAAVAVHAPASRMPLTRAIEHLASLQQAATWLRKTFQD